LERRVYLDANAFILAYETDDARSAQARAVLTEIQGGELVGVSSELTLAELLVKPLELSDAELVEAYKSMFTTTASFEVISVTREILIAAAELRAGRKSLRLPDAVHAATALSSGCGYFVSGDGRLGLPEGLKQIDLSAASVAEILAVKE
jgi:predicted nucleic acid-binding protein